MKTIIANWKANPTTLEDALDLFDFYLSEISKYKNISLIVCPPFVFIEELVNKLAANGDINNLRLGAQDLFWEKAGPYTGSPSSTLGQPKVLLGEVSVDMLKNFNISHALVGHSDRRYKMAETDEMINKKIKAAWAANIIPVLLVGERNKNDERAVVLEQQLTADLDSLAAEQISKILITYEPVWAISTTPGAEPDTPESTLEAVEIINEFLSKTYNLKPTTCLYGGSVNENNVVDFLKHLEISGAVIGGASLRKGEFAEMLGRKDIC